MPRDRSTSTRATSQSRVPVTLTSEDAGHVREAPVVGRKGRLRIDTIRLRDNQRPRGTVRDRNQMNAARSFACRPQQKQPSEVQPSRVPGCQPLTVRRPVERIGAAEVAHSPLRTAKRGNQVNGGIIGSLPNERDLAPVADHVGLASPAIIKACARTDEPSARVAPGRTGRLSSRGRDRYRLRLCTSDPSRIGCCSEAELVELAHRRRPMDDPAYTHVGKCSPCYRKLRAIQGMKTH